MFVNIKTFNAESYKIFDWIYQTDWWHCFLQIYSKCNFPAGFPAKATDTKYLLTKIILIYISKETFLQSIINAVVLKSEKLVLNLSRFKI